MSLVPGWQSMTGLLSVGQSPQPRRYRLSRVYSNCRTITRWKSKHDLLQVADIIGMNKLKNKLYIISLHILIDKLAMKTNKQFLLHLILILSSIKGCLAAWATYTQFIGYIPSYTYPINLNAGDSIRGFLSWPGTQDLDIYLYSDGMDLLSRSTYLDRQFSPSLNPEDLIFTIPTTKLYYLRVDLYSSVPTRYNFQISVNGNLVSTFTDTVITVTSGRTAQQFSVSGPCQIRVKYDGPIYNIYLFAPGVDVIAGAPAASDTTSTNPKQITHMLTSGGNWNIVIHHGLTSTLSLTPFKIVVETNQGANQCINFCSSIAHSAGIVSGLASTCYCETGFEWVSSNQTCAIICSQFNSSGATGSRASGSSDRCQCLDSSYTWDTVSLTCAINCSTVAFSTGNNGTDSCLCISGYEWNAALRKCVKNCTAISYSTGASASNVSQCDCQTNFYWQPITQTCRINCTLIPYTPVSATGTIDTCPCITNFQWDSSTKQCIINCTFFNGTDGTRVNGTIDQCNCQQVYMDWYPGLSQCQINCSKLEYAIASDGNGGCICENKFVWHATNDSCIIDCPSLNNTEIPFNVANSSDSCNCLSNYQWNQLILQCEVNCSTVEYATTNLPNTTEVCQCQSTFYWNLQPPSSQCLINCSLYADTVSSLTSSVDSCECRQKYNWDPNTLSCLINCTQIVNTFTGNGSNSTSLNGNCLCLSLFVWDSTIQQCVIDCTLINNTQVNGSINGSYDRCLCQPGYSWDMVSLSCQPVDGVPEIMESVVLDWVYGDVCSRQLQGTIKVPVINPVIVYTIVQLYNGDQNGTRLDPATPDATIQSLQYDASQNSIKLKLNLLSNPQSMYISLKGAPSSPVPFLAFPVTFSGTIGAALYSESECQLAKSITGLVKFMPIAAYFIMGSGIGSFSYKIIGLELFGVLQLAYFSVSQHYNDINLYIYQLSGLKISNGANIPIFDEAKELFYEKLPKVFKSDPKINGYLINNYNVMYLVLLVFSAVFFCIYICLVIYRLFISATLPETNAIHNESNQQLDTQRKSPETSNCASKAEHIVLRILKQGIITILLFSAFNISFSTAVFYQYSQKIGQNSFALTLSVIQLAILAVIGFIMLIDFIRVGSSVASYGEFKENFKLNWLCRLYIPISLIYRFAIGAMIGAKLQDIYSTLFVLFIASIFLLFNLINLPFSSPAQNYRANLIHITQLITLFVANYYRSMKANLILSKKAHIHAPAVVLIIFLATSVIVSLLMTFYQIYRKIKYMILKCKKNNEVKNQNERDQADNQFSSKREMSRPNNNINMTDQHFISQQN